MVCAQCGVSVERQRSTKRFCSSGCRVIAFYAKRLGVGPVPGKPPGSDRREGGEVSWNGFKMAEPSLSESDSEPQPPAPVDPPRLELVQEQPAEVVREAHNLQPPAEVVPVAYNFPPPAPRPTPERLSRAARLLGYRGALSRENIEKLLERRRLSRGLSPEAKLKFQQAAEALLAALGERATG